MTSGNTISLGLPVRRHSLIDKVRRAREKRGGWRTASSQS
jgi:hypothetical protein